MEQRLEKQEKLARLSARVQKLGIDLYRICNLHTKLDEYMKKDLLEHCVSLYTRAADLCDYEDDYFREYAMFGGLKSHLVHLNSQLLMCFQLGMLNSDVCIDLGYQIEQLKNEFEIEYAIAKKEMEEKNPFLNFDDEDIDDD